MSDVLQKSLSTFYEILSNSFSNTYFFDSIHSNKKINDFISSLKNAHSKKDQRYLLANQLEDIKAKLAQPGISLEDVACCLLLAIFIKTLGHDVSFINIHALKLAAQGNIKHKKIGYQTASLLLKPKDNLHILLINTLQKDIESSSDVEICLGLRAVTSIFSQDFLSLLLPLVERRLCHPKESVRVLALGAIHHCFHQFLCQPDQTHQDTPWMASMSLLGALFKCLQDRCHSVVAASISVFLKLVSSSPQGLAGIEVENFVEALVNILRAVINRYCSTSLRKGVPSPHLQLSLLRLLALLARNSSSQANSILTVVKETLQRIQVNQLVSYAIVAECVLTLVELEASKDALEIALSKISNLINSSNVNLKFVGLKCLMKVVGRIDAKYVLVFQDAILSCLKHPDPHIKNMTVGILVEIANPVNHKNILLKVLEVLESSGPDQSIRSQLAHHMALLINKVPIQSEFLVSFVNQLAEKCKELITMDFINFVVSRLKKETSEANKAKCYDIYLKLLKSENEKNNEKESPLPGPLLCLSSWVIGQWNHCVSEEERNAGQECLVAVAKRVAADTVQVPVLLWILAALRKSIIHSGLAPPSVTSLPPFLMSSHPFYSIVYQKAQEFSYILEHLSTLCNLLNSDTTVSKIDPTLTCLDLYVLDALEKGAEPYQPQVEQASNSLLGDWGRSRSSSPLGLTGHEMTESLTSSLALSYQSLDSSATLLSAGSSPFKTETAPRKVWTLEGRTHTTSAPPSSSNPSTQFLKPSSEKDFLEPTNLFAGIETKNQETASLFAGIIPSPKVEKKEVDDLPPLPPLELPSELAPK